MGGGATRALGARDAERVRGGATGSVSVVQLNRGRRESELESARGVVRIHGGCVHRGAGTEVRQRFCALDRESKRTKRRVQRARGSSASRVVVRFGDAITEGESESSRVSASRSRVND